MKNIFNWKEEELPLIYAAILDINFFRREVLFFVIHLIKKTEDFDNEILLGWFLLFYDVLIILLKGQVALNLNELMANEGKTTIIEENISLFGRIFGELTGLYNILNVLSIFSGEIEYEIYELDDSKT